MYFSQKSAKALLTWLKDVKSDKSTKTNNDMNKLLHLSYQTLHGIPLRLIYLGS